VLVIVIGSNPWGLKSAQRTDSRGTFPAAEFAIRSGDDIDLLKAGIFRNFLLETGIEAIEKSATTS
jgi:hypothetical protein